MTTLALDPFGPPQLPFREAGLQSLAPPDPAILDRNLAVLSRTSARAADLVRYSAPRPDLRFLRTDEGVLSVEIVDPLDIAPPRALASRRRPTREGEQLADTIDIASTAAVAVMGFGAGYHVAALARRMRRTGVIAVFEPDVALLRAVLERIDHSDWLGASNTAVFTDPDDAAAISASLSGVEGIVMMGLSLLEHAPSLDRLGEARTRFYRNLQDVIAAIRTTVATTMVQVKTTVANLVRNIPWYVSAPGIADLAGTRAGTPAIVVSAGPSLQRNIEQLSRDGVRDRFTIIAAQTVLKPLLVRGIKPHYVVALDHSEISARFYEGLSRDDVAGVTLVVEPKVSPAVPRAFPGDVRLARDPFLDMLLGAELARDMGTLPPGATVAHLAYYLARHLGADPVVLVGQDLGFTDGQYYAANAAIHDVWACELNQFNSLERMEWERIKRMGSHLRRATDHLGRQIFTDEQLATYLVQFERDFLADTQRGMTIIDATEGGVAKRHTRAEPLRDVVDRWLASAPLPLEQSGPQRTTSTGASRASLRRVEERVRAVHRSVGTIAELSRKTISLLTEMLANHADQRRVSRLIDDVHRVRDEVEAMSPGIELVHYLNQAGAFTRVRADRSIQLDASLTPLQRQRREIERDIANVELLASTADDLGAELAIAGDALVRWQNERPTAGTMRRTAPQSLAFRASAAAPPAGAHAVIAVPSLPAGMAVGGRADRINALRLTIQRLARAERLESVVLLAEEADAVRAQVVGLNTRIPVRVQPASELFGHRHESIRAARAGALDCWRAGLAGACVYDEVLAPEATLRAMTELSIDAALIVGADWCFVDPDLCDDIIERSERSTGTHRLAFSQAPPGAAGLLLNRALLADLIKLRAGTSPFATIGGLLAYLPTAPAFDPIGRDVCAPIDPVLRDAGMRLIPDSPWRAASMARLVDALGPEQAAAAATTELIASLIEDTAGSPQAPTLLTIELGAKRRLSRETLERLIADFSVASPGALLTIRAEPQESDGVADLIAASRVAGGAFTQLRTALGAGVDPATLAAVGVDIIAIDLPTPSDTDAWNRAHRELEALVGALQTSAVDGRPHPWLVPRLIKSDASYPVLEGFFDRWLLTTGAAAIDPLADAHADERIAPLPWPAAVRRRLERSAMYVRDDGTAHACDFFDRARANSPAADLSAQPLADAWRRVLGARGVLEREAAR